MLCIFVDYRVPLAGQRNLIDAQRWRRDWINPDCTEDNEDILDCDPADLDKLCWFLLEKVTDGRDTDGQFLKAISRTETRLSRK